MQAFQKQFDELRAIFRVLYDNILLNKSFDATFREEQGYDKLVDANILWPQEGSRYKLKFSGLSCYCLSTCLLNEDELNADLSSLDAILNFTKKVIQVAKRKEIYSGIAEFAINLNRFLIIEAYDCGHNYNSSIISIQKDHPKFYQLVSPMAMAICDLGLDVETAYKMFSNLWAQIENDGLSTDVATALKEYARIHGKAMSELILKDTNVTPGFASMVLTGYHRQGQEDFWEFLRIYSQLGHQSELLCTLANLEFKKAEDVFNTYASIQEIEILPENQWRLVYVYTAVANSELANDSIRQESLNELKRLSQIEDEKIILNLLSELRFLKNHDEVKLEIVLGLDFRRENIYTFLNFLIDDFSTTEYFQVVYKIIHQLKTNFKPDHIQQSLTSVQRRDPIKFSNSLVEMLIHKEGLIRFSGCHILQELNRHHRFDFANDLLAYSERDQVRIIDSILFDFTHPEKVISYILHFRNSQHRQVLQFLTKSLLNLISDYSEKALKAIRALLAQNKDDDNKLLEFCERANEQLTELITNKHKIEEFKPQKNRATAFNHFERLYRTRMDETLSVSHNEYMNNDPLFSMVHAVKIVRGKSWRIESKGGEPDELSEISVVISLPRTFLMNPDGYNYAMRLKILSQHKH